jgi:ABC-type branched-subunit amino acid transport system substrate-binding protein
MKMQFTTALTLLTISLLLVSCGEPPYECADPLGCIEISPGRPVFIGALLTVYGSQGAAGRKALDDIKTAIQATELIFDHKIQLAWQGTDCSGENARLAATLLTEIPDMLAVIGPTCVADAQIAIPILEDAGLPIIPPSPSAIKAFQRLVFTIEQTAIQQPNGALVLPRTALQQAILGLP